VIRAVWAAAVCLTLLGIQADRAFSQNPLIGLKGGFNVSWVNGGDAESFWGLDQSRTGFAFGAFVTYKFSPNFSLQPEGFYTQLGGKGGDETTGISLRLHYVEAPILAKFTLPNRSYLTPHLVVGPSIYARVGCNVDRRSNGTTESGGCEDWLAETPIGRVPLDTKLMGLGFVVGLGFDAPLWGRFISVDVRYGSGLSSIDDSNLGTDIKNHYFQIMLGYGWVWDI
jgi:hypothetical protein